MRHGTSEVQFPGSLTELLRVPRTEVGPNNWTRKLENRHCYEKNVEPLFGVIQKKTKNLLKKNFKKTKSMET